MQRQFTADRPDRLWVCDLTYLRTWAGFAYLALVIDVFSRRILGWALATHMRTDLPLEALEMAIWTRQHRVAGLVHHTDAGSQHPLRRDPRRGRRCPLRRVGRRQLRQRAGRADHRTAQKPN